MGSACSFGGAVSRGPTLVLALLFSAAACSGVADPTTIANPGMVSSPEAGADLGQSVDASLSDHSLAVVGAPAPTEAGAETAVFFGAPESGLVVDAAVSVDGAADVVGADATRGDGGDAGGDAGGTDAGATFACGNLSCTVATQTCCVPAGGNVQTMTTCAGAAGCPIGTGASLRCVATADCPANGVCCLSQAMGAASACRVQCMGGQRQLCDPTVANAGCPFGQLCLMPIGGPRLPNNVGVCQ
jgi:hypothetical protein